MVQAKSQSSGLVSLAIIVPFSAGVPLWYPAELRSILLSVFSLPGFPGQGIADSLPHTFQVRKHYVCYEHFPDADDDQYRITRSF